jgi:predicted glycogen debranching enzyme
VLAGYPWFGDWGRDTMIALPGLTLSTGRFDDARSILATFAAHCSEGMLPNKFPNWDGEELMYNTIDASLWYFWAVDRFLAATGDHDFVRTRLWPVLQSIIDWHLKGTRYGIKVDPADGLVSGGDESTQLTWMDVKYQGWAVTPRWGKAVEINALWYNALRVMEILATRYSADSLLYRRQAELCHANFARAFWDPERRCLFDYRTPEGPNRDIRPNQIFAVSLPHSLLSPEQEKAVVDKVLEHCWTPHGLKSIAEDDPKFIGSYLGDLKARDSCYHQGTVWSWPIGHFIDAHRKVHGDTAKLKLLLAGLEDHFYQEACVNNVSEIFDGAPPHAARGCSAQAWSVGELIRVLKEDLGRK